MGACGAPPSGTTQRSSSWPAASTTSSKTPPGALGPWVTESTRTQPTLFGSAAPNAAKQPSSGIFARPESAHRVASGLDALEECRRQCRRLDASARRDSGLVEQPAQDRRASRREVVAVVVEHRIDLVGLVGELRHALDPLGELLRRVHPVEALGRLLGLDVPGLDVAAVEADVRDR